MRGQFFFSLLAALALISFFPAAAQDYSTWNFDKVGDFPQPPRFLGMVVAEFPVDGNAWIFGGSDGGPVWRSDVQVYDIKDDQWTVHSSALPYPYHENSRYGVALASDGKFYLSPGNGPGGWGQHRRIIEFDPVSATSVERAVIPVGSNIWGCAISAALPPAEGVYIMGGWNGGGLPHVFHYAPSTDQMRFIGNLSVGRSVGARVSHPNGNVYLFGGNRSTHSIDVLDRSTETLRAIPNPGLFRFNHGTHGWIAADGSIHLWNPIVPALGHASDQIVRFDVDSETFSLLSDPPYSGGGIHSAVQYGDDVYAFGITEPGYIWGVYGISRAEVWRLSRPCTLGPGTPWVVERQRGKPQWESMSWESCGGEATLTIAVDRAAAARIVLNATELFRENDFHTGVTHLEQIVVLEEGQNQIEVLLMSGPSATLQIDITE